MDKEELIKEIGEIRKNLKSSLVRRKEQLKGMIWLIEHVDILKDIEIVGCETLNDRILKKIKENYEVK